MKQTYTPRPKKNIIICCDGTANNFGSQYKNSNVVKLFSCLKFPNLGEEPNLPLQLAYYDPGVGTMGASAFNPFKKIKLYRDRATGWGVDDNVQQAYQYLMNSYEEGDRIFLFGFSRGAYTVRVLTGLLYKCGLLYKRNTNQIEYAYEEFRKNNNEDIAKEFKQNFSREVKIHFVGVWDTVSAIFTWGGKKGIFKDLNLMPNVENAFQALAIDEKRRLFKPLIWNSLKSNEESSMEQVWFAGVHSDVGGGYERHGLANISLQWMLKKAYSYGLLIKQERVLSPDFMGKPNGTKNESYTAFWKTFRPYIRPINEQSNIHPSVYERLKENISNYKPSNLPDLPKVIDEPKWDFLLKQPQYDNTGQWIKSKLEKE